MGICLSKQQQPMKKQPQSVDIVVAKLKIARDTIKKFISLKNKDLNKIEEQLKSKYPEFEATGCKRKLVPLLQAKKEIMNRLDNANTRYKVIDDKLYQVQLQKMDVDMVNVLDESNQYIKNAQEEMERRDWRNVLQQANKKYSIQWPDDRDEIEEDQAFKELWNQIGGNKLPVKTKVPEKKTVNVDTNVQKQQYKKQQYNLA